MTRASTRRTAALTSRRKTGASHRGNFLEQTAAMKAILLMLVCVVLTGCSRYPSLALKRYEDAQEGRFRRYVRGTRSEAKIAVREMIDAAEKNKGKLKYRYSNELEIAICYARLAVIAEAENEIETAKGYWAAAVEAQLRFQKDQRHWARASPNVSYPDEDSDVYERVTAEQIRKFLLGLEKNQPFAWKEKKGD